MPRGVSAGVTLVCLALLTVACFGNLLFRDHQLSYRDAAEYHEPLAQTVRQEWAAGRWPLWDPSVNGGTPLLGNPAAAVLYPGKLVEVLPPPWGGRLYVVGHVWLALLTMRVMLRSWGVGRDGASLGGLAYAFGAPVLFQVSNVIYLVGAAWAPLGLWAVDRVVRERSVRAAVALALVLALMVLGGDPETACLVAVWGTIEAAIGSEPRQRWLPDGWRIPGGRVGILAAVGIAFAAWVGVTLSASWWFGSQREGVPQGALRGYSGWFPLGLLTLWIVGVLAVWKRQRDRPGGDAPLARLLGAGMLALGLAAVQIGPSWELIGSSVRTNEGSGHETDAFSLEPYRLVEWIWPGVFGSFPRADRQWLSLLPPRHLVQTWVPSLYMGGLTLVLALAGSNSAGTSGRAQTRLRLIGFVSFLGALGVMGSPVWWARSLPHADAWLGTAESGGVSQGAGGMYWLLATLIPGFQAFRYPSKLLTFTALSLAGLAGMGWDRLAERRAWRGAVVALVLSGLALGAALAARGPFIAWVQRAAGSTPTVMGPFDGPGAWHDLVAALGHATVVMALVCLVIRLRLREARLAGIVALGLVTADLVVANRALVTTAPRSLFSGVPLVAQRIAEAESHDPSPGPFRVHRMPAWFPAAGFGRAADPLQALTRWEFDTLKPRYGTGPGLAYTLAGGGLERADYNAFLGARYVPLDTRRAPLRGAANGQLVLAYNRRGYDLWGTRYFVVPMDPGSWQDPARGIASFLTVRTIVTPPATLLESPDQAAALETWVAEQDWMLIRNRAAYPRAWVVHRARFEAPISPSDSERRDALLDQMLYPADDPLWHEPGRKSSDPRTVAWIETDDPRRLARYSPGPDPARDARESVRVVRDEPQRVEIEVDLLRPGFVILAEVDAPGWNLTIDGVSSSRLRANLLMRGAAVAAGRHRLVYAYQPMSFRLGGIVSLLSLTLTVGILVVRRT